MTKFFSLVYRLRKTALLPALTLLVIVVSSCAVRPGPSLSESARRHRPVRLAAGVQARPGSVAWSPDGKILAFLDGKVNLYDPDTAGSKSIAIADSRFLSWSADDRLLVLFGEQKHGAVAAFDRSGIELNKMPVADGAEAIYFSSKSGKLLVLARRVEYFPFGMEIDCQVSVYDNDGTAKALFGLSKTYPAKQLDVSALFAWTHAGLNPADGSLLVMEHLRPPAKTLYSRVVTVDPVSGAVDEVVSGKHGVAYASATWSPDGRSIALTDEDGRLLVQRVHTAGVFTDQHGTGFYPSWNPKGGRIYCGGSVIDLDTKSSESLLTDGARSVASWSPDGTALAVASNGELWLFRGFLPASPVREPSKDR